MDLTTKPATLPVEASAVETAPKQALMSTKPSLNLPKRDRLPHQMQAIAELALQGKCRSLLEFAAFDRHHVKLISDEIAKRSHPTVEPITLEADSAKALESLPEGSVDLAFSVQSLAQLDNPKRVLKALLRISDRFVALLEVVHAKSEASSKGQSPAHRRLHGHKAVFEDTDLEPCLIMPLPTDLSEAGQRCKLVVIDKAAPQDRLDSAALRERLFEAVTLQLLGQLAVCQAEENNLKDQLSTAQDQLGRARISAERMVQNQLPHQAGQVLIDHVKRPYKLPILPWSLYRAYKKVRSDMTSGDKYASDEATAHAYSTKRSPVTGLDELVLPQVDDPLLATIQTRYDETYQRDYGVTQGRGFFRDADWRRINYAANLLPPDAKSVLDVGVGAGVLLNYLTMAERFDDVVGIDIDRHSKFLSLSSDVDWRRMDACSMSFPDNQFDIVFCMEVLEHLEDVQLEQALAELRRVTRHRLVASVPFDEPRPLPSFHKQHFDKKRIEGVFPTASITLLHKQRPRKPAYAKASRICPWALIVEDQRQV